VSEEEINQDDTANTLIDAEELVPLEVKIIKEKEEIVNEDIDYEDTEISKEEIEEFEK